MAAKMNGICAVKSDFIFTPVTHCTLLQRFCDEEIVNAVWHN